MNAIMLLLVSLLLLVFLIPKSSIDSPIASRYIAKPKRVERADTSAKPSKGTAACSQFQAQSLYTESKPILRGSSLICEPQGYTIELLGSYTIGTLGLRSKLYRFIGPNCRSLVYGATGIPVNQLKDFTDADLVAAPMVLNQKSFRQYGLHQKDEIILSSSIYPEF